MRFKNSNRSHSPKISRRRNFVGGIWRSLSTSIQKMAEKSVTRSKSSMRETIEVTTVPESVLEDFTTNEIFHVRTLAG